MMPIFSTVEEYISTFDEEKQHLLQELLRIIRTAIPPDATEVINYNIPTIRWNGNLFHFALFKNHIGLYPGPGAIDACKDQLQNYKTRKGTIQLPIDGPLPKKLITDLIAFNIKLFEAKHRTAKASKK